MLARVVACAGIGCNTLMGRVVRFGTSTPPFEPGMKGGLATPTPMGKWPGHQLVPPPGT